MTETSTRGLKLHHELHIEVLYGYLTEHLGPVYAEAELLFSKGYVDRRHWSRLFPPGSVVVTFEYGQSMAFVCETCPTLRDSALQLQCRSWNFDGVFFQKSITLQIKWLSNTDESIVSITDLKAYPLICDCLPRKGAPDSR
jgi:hypothetical protein